MFRHNTMLFIALLLFFGLTACNSDSDLKFHAPENLNFSHAGLSTEGPTRITWSDRELTFYPLSSPDSLGQEFMMVDLMGDQSIEYILRNDRLEEARFSLPDGSLVRFDIVGLLEKGAKPLVYHCTPSSNAFYELDALPEKLANSIAGYHSKFGHWSNHDVGILHHSETSKPVPYERILKSVCSAAKLI